MNTKVSDLVIDIRDVLGDFDSTRYSDERILRAINRANLEFSVATEVLTSKTNSLESTKCRGLYKLKDEAITLTRCTIDGKSIPIVSNEDMDLIEPYWAKRTTEDKVTHVIYDKLDKGFIRLYPLLEEGVVRLNSTNSPYGALVVPTTSSSSVGFIQSLSDDSSLSTCKNITNTENGILNNATMFAIDLDFYHTKKADIVTIDSNQEFDTMWDSAIVNYSLYMLLSSDRDDQNRALANAMLKEYGAKVKQAIRHKSRNFSRANQYVTEYRQF